VNRRGSAERKALLDRWARRVWIWLRVMKDGPNVALVAEREQYAPPAQLSATHRSSRSASAMASRRISSWPGLP
jgi:hypothetical protein